MGDETQDVSEKLEDLSYKVLLVGNSGVGKTAIVNRYIDNAFDDKYTPTIGFKSKAKDVDICGRPLTLQVMDMGGEEKSNTSTETLYSECHGIVFVYDVTNQESFEQLKDWMREIKIFEMTDVCKMIVGNKSDISDARVVDFEKAKTFAADAHVLVREVSGKTGEGVDDLFMDVIVCLLESLEDDLPVARMKFSQTTRKIHRAAWCSVI